MQWCPSKEMCIIVSTNHVPWFSWMIQVFVCVHRWDTTVIYFQGTGTGCLRSESLELAWTYVLVWKMEYMPLGSAKSDCWLFIICVYWNWLTSKRHFQGHISMFKANFGAKRCAEIKWSTSAKPSLGARWYVQSEEQQEKTYLPARISLNYMQRYKRVYAPISTTHTHTYIYIYYVYTVNR